MKIKQSVKKVWNEAKREPVFALLYVGGVAMGIAFIVIYSIMYYVQVAPIYPEYERASTLTLSTVSITKTNMMMSSAMGKSLVRNDLPALDGVELVAAVGDGGKPYVQTSVNGAEFEVVSNLVNPDFFKLFAYDFISGRPFNADEDESEQKIVIITDETARKAFGTVDDVVGRDIIIGFIPYRVIGVVRAASTIAASAYGDVFVPVGPTQPVANLEDEVGGFRAYVKMLPGYGEEKLAKEIENLNMRKYLAADTTEYESFEIKAPRSLVKSALKVNPKDTTWWDIIKGHMYVLLVLLVIPALNISGMIAAQMERKYSEIGIRRSFGATKNSIIRQILAENLYLTIAGGIIGLICAWIFIYGGQNWIFNILADKRWGSTYGIPTHVTGEMLFAPAVFIFTFVLCLVLNLVSAYIPVRWTLRKQVVEYINDNK